MTSESRSGDELTAERNGFSSAQIFSLRLFGFLDSQSHSQLDRAFVSPIRREAISKLREARRSLIPDSDRLRCYYKCRLRVQQSCLASEKVLCDGCDHLESVAFFLVGLRALNLGICPNMVLLELKGCVVLSEASIICPLLTSLDASFYRLCSSTNCTSLTSFCSQLRDDCLSATVASCPSVNSDGLYCLCWLPNLIVLDLSYTFLMTLKPVFDSCIKLKHKWRY